MRHDMFIAFETSDGHTAWINPDCVTAVCERKGEAEGRDHTRSLVYTNDGTGSAFHLKDEASVVVNVITTAREAVQGDKAEDAEAPG